MLIRLKQTERQTGGTKLNFEQALAASSGHYLPVDSSILTIGDSS